MSKQIATTTILKRISGYLALHLDENDITWDELSSISPTLSREQFADAMKYLLDEGIIKCVITDTNKKCYFFNNLNSPSYRKVNKVLHNEKEYERQQKWGKEGERDDN